MVSSLQRADWIRLLIAPRVPCGSTRYCRAAVVSVLRGLSSRLLQAAAAADEDSGEDSDSPMDKKDANTASAPSIKPIFQIELLFEDNALCFQPSEADHIELLTQVRGPHRAREWSQY